MQHNITVWSQGNYCVPMTDPFFYENFYFLTLLLLYSIHGEYIFYFSLCSVVNCFNSMFFLFVYLFSLISDLASCQFGDLGQKCLWNFLGQISQVHNEGIQKQGGVGWGIKEKGKMSLEQGLLVYERREVVQVALPVVKRKRSWA